MPRLERIGEPRGYWWMYTFPAAVIVLFGIAVALFYDGAERLLAGPRPVQ